MLFILLFIIAVYKIISCVHNEQIIQLLIVQNIQKTG